MNERCPACSLKFEREQGYFLGAMYISYMISIVPVLLLALLFWLLIGLPYDWSILAAFVAYIPFVPPVVRLSRVLWIHFDQRLDPEL